LDGPAVEFANGEVEYWENGKQSLTQKEIKEMTVAEISEQLGYEIKVVK